VCRDADIEEEHPDALTGHKGRPTTGATTANIMFGSFIGRFAKSIARFEWRENFLPPVGQDTNAAFYDPESAEGHRIRDSRVHVILMRRMKLALYRRIRANVRV
jgi:hypothetical protein